MSLRYGISLCQEILLNAASRNVTCPAGSLQSVRIIILKAAEHFDTILGWIIIKKKLIVIPIFSPSFLSEIIKKSKRMSI